MFFFRRFSINVHFILISTIVIGMFAVFSIWYFYDRYSSQTMEGMLSKSRSIASMLAFNSSAGVVFQDTATIEDVLKSVKEDPTLDAAYVYDLTGKRLGAYESGTAAGNNKADPIEVLEELGARGEKVSFHDRHIYISRDIETNSEKIGTLLLFTDTSSIQTTLESTLRSTLLAYAGLFVVAIFLIMFLTRSLLIPIRQAAAVAHRLSEGYLDVEELDERGHDEIAKMSAALNVMVGSIRNMIEQIKKSNESINQTISEIQTSTVQQRHGLENQATAISEISTTINQLKTTAKQSASIAQRVLDDSERSVEVSGQGLDSNEKAVGGMNQINEQMETIAETILSLSERSQQIVDIVATVNDLAQQSNYLALNASIEAAKAGEHGKGFAVVAMEVRNLAEQSQQATAQIKNILNEIQSTMNSAVLVTESGTLKAKEGVDIIRGTGGVINQLADVVNQGATSARQISASANQQSMGIDQIAQAINAISETMNETTGAAKQLEKAAEGLAEVGHGMTSTLENYVVK